MRRRTAQFLQGSAGTFLLALVSVVLAWAVWFIVRQEVRDEEVFTVTVVAQVEHAPDLQATVMRDSVEVRLTIAGPKGDVAAVRASGDRSAVLYISPTDIPPENRDATRTFELRDLHFGPLAFFESTQAIAMEPAKLKVKITRFAEKAANVLSPPLPEDEFSGFRLDILSLPPTARVRGPLSTLASFSDLATRLDKDQLVRAIDRMEDEPHQTVYIDLVPEEQEGTVFGDEVELLDEPFATVKITHLETAHRWVDLSIVASQSSGALAGALRFSSVNKTNFRQLYDDDEDAWISGRDDKPARARLAFRGAPKRLAELATEGLRGIVLVDGLIDADGNPIGGNAALRMLDLPLGVTLERTYQIDVEVAR